MSGSGTLQPNSGLRYHTDSDSPLPETINPIIDAVESVAAKKHITESGSNDDGYYIKFDDGTMVCYGSFSSNSFINNASGGGVYKTLSNTFIINTLSYL